VIEISIGPKAQYVIEDELKRAERNIQRGREVGGWLWSRQDSAWWGGLEIVEAAGPGPDDIYTFAEVTFMKGHLHDLDEMFRRDGLELCGGWHVHPSGDTMPSSIDEGRIATVLKLREDWDCRTQRAVELIYAPNNPCNGYGHVHPSGGFTVEPWAFCMGEGRFTGRPMPQPVPAVLVTGTDLLRGA
jgi:proteasome lid subunit RPN8/RPN11